MLTTITEAGNYAWDVINTATGAVTSTATGIFDGAMDIASQTRRGWENTKDQVESSELVQKLMRLQEQIGMGKEGKEGGGGP